MWVRYRTRYRDLPRLFVIDGQVTERDDTAPVAVLAFGLNHTSAPVSVRERVSMPVDLMRPALEGLRSAFGGAVREAADALLEARVRIDGAFSDLSSRITA